jgi:hypothetical protein
MRLTAKNRNKQQETNSPNQITIYYIWKNWKRGLMGPAIEKFDRVDKIGIIKAHIGPHPIQLIER